MNSLTEFQRFSINDEALRKAREHALLNGRPLVEVLEEQLNLAPDLLVECFAREFQYEPINWHALIDAHPDFGVIPYAEAIRRECVAVRDSGERLRIIVSNPYEAELLSWVEARTDEEIEYCVGHRLEILGYLAKQEESIRAMDGASVETPITDPQRDSVEELTLSTITESESPVVRFVSSMLYDALKSRASDIHLEAHIGGLTVKYRIDGVLGVVKVLNGIELSEQIISRIKIMTELDIAERRIPQDGRFKALSRGQEIDFRVSIMPSIHGEDAVVRILDKRYLADQTEGLRLEHLGLSKSIMEQLRWLAAQPYGMLLVTGPTGSGKTTTLYALLSEVNRGLDKIITIEDPVEYQLPGVLQIPVNEKKGLTFARGLRSILRHDPDRIMVGEIRDPETAEIAVQSALTGHVVYTTVHANSVVDVIGRLLHMKIDAYSFVSAINGVMAQRLIRVNCPQCAVEYQPDDEVLHNSRLPQVFVQANRFMRGRGCSECRATGYKGRKAIAELLVFNDDIRELIVARGPAKALKERALANGTRFLRDAALELVAAGETTLEEANRVTLVA